VFDLVRELDSESGISRSTVTRICAEIEDGVAEFIARRLDHISFPYLFVDVGHNGRVVSQAVAVVTGVSAQDRRFSSSETSPVVRAESRASFSASARFSATRMRAAS